MKHTIYYQSGYNDTISKRFKTGLSFFGHEIYYSATKYTFSFFTKDGVLIWNLAKNFGSKEEAIKEFKRRMERINNTQFEEYILTVKKANNL